MPMIAMTTSSSTKVNARPRADIVLLFCVPERTGPETSRIAIAQGLLSAACNITVSAEFARQTNLKSYRADRSLRQASDRAFSTAGTRDTRGRPDTHLVVSGAATHRRRQQHTQQKQNRETISFEATNLTRVMPAEPRHTFCAGCREVTQISPRMPQFS